MDYKKLTMQCFEEHAFGEGSFERKKREYGRKIRKIASEAREEKNLYDIFVTSHDLLLNHFQVILKYKEVIYVKKFLHFLIFSKEKYEALEVLQQRQKENNEGVRKNLEKQSMLDENLQSIVKSLGDFQVFNSTSSNLFERR